MKRIVVKVGSRVLTEKDGSLNGTMIADIVKNIARIKKEAGVEVILVSSGAVSTGKSMVNLDDFRLSAEAIKYDKTLLKSQIYASVGQAKLITVYQNEFEKYGISSAQILVSRRRFADREEYLSLKTLVDNQLRLGIIPIFNEDDTLRPAKIRFSDNDQVACMITAMTVSEILIMLTDVEGVMDGPLSDSGSKVIPEIVEVDDFMSKIDLSAKISKGGMRNKLIMADLVTSLGSSMRIANGFQENVLSRIVIGKEQLGTFFPPKRKKASGIKSWLSTSATSDGKIVVSTYLADILRNKQTASVLFAGIESIEGNFDEKDVVDICDESGAILGRGIIKFSTEELKEKVRRHKEMSEEERDSMKTAEMIAVHYDYLVFI
jgi:glutamate 5-kinase